MKKEREQSIIQECINVLKEHDNGIIMKSCREISNKIKNTTAIEILKILSKNPEIFVLCLNPDYDEDQGPMFALKEDLVSLTFPEDVKDLIVTNEENENMIVHLANDIRNILSDIDNVIEMHGMNVLEIDEKLFELLNSIRSETNRFLVKIELQIKNLE